MTGMSFAESRRKLDFIVGLFIFFAAVAVVFIALRAANITEYGKAGYEIRVQFDHIGALGSRAPVRSSGVRVGRVQSVYFNNELFLAEVILVIDNRYKFPSDSVFAIVSSNLLGGQYVSITPGGAEDDLKGGAVMTGESAIVLEHLIGKFLFSQAEKE